MSPVLTQAVPVGSLEGRVVKTRPPSASAKNRQNLVRDGWKMEGFASAALKISTAASRLREEAETESKYWEQISRLKAAGWAVSRLPRDNRLMCVHFGFTEAAPGFRNRGYAVLRQGEAGNLFLDRGGVSAKRSVLQVTVHQNGHSISQSSVPELELKRDAGIEDQIIQARNLLFEEELFFEIGREARGLASQGVTMVANSVKLDIGSDVLVLIRLISLETQAYESEIVHSGVSSYNLAEAVAIALRILLVYAHRQNYERRCKGPLPMTLNTKHGPEYALLRPVMCHLQHSSHVRSLETILVSIMRPLSNAGLEVKCQIHKLSQLDFSRMTLDPALSSDSLANALLEPLVTKFTIMIPTRRSLELIVRTHLAAPTFGTEFEINSLKYGGHILKPPHLETESAVSEFLCNTIMVDIVVFIADMDIQSQNSISEEKGHESKGWNISDFYGCQLSLVNQPSMIKHIQIKFGQNRLGLRFMSRESNRGQQVQLRTFSWLSDKFWEGVAGKTSEGAPRKLADVIRELSSFKKSKD